VGIVLAALVLVGCSSGASIRGPEPHAADLITVRSPVFGDGQPIPREYTCHGAGGPPELAWRGVPAGTTSLALVVSDPDAPGGTFVHWILYDLPPQDGRLQAGRAPLGAREGRNSGGKAGWYPPCPPSGTHRYRFTVYALNDHVRGSSTQDLLDDIARKTLARGTLTGLVTSG
jgi:Raf kinase inhibitor-like YbhB/YbcL family protein